MGGGHCRQTADFSAVSEGTFRKAEQRATHWLQRKGLPEHRACGPPTCSLVMCVAVPFLESGKKLVRRFFMRCQVNQVSYHSQALQGT